MNAFPGLHYRELQRASGAKDGTFQYHLSVLEKDGVVVREPDGVYVRFYPAHLSQAERRALGLLRHSKIRSILLYLLQEPQLGKGELAKKLGVSPSTVSYYIERLRKANILSFAEGNRATFLVDPAMLIGLLRRYRSSFLDRLVDSFVELWEFKREE